MSYTATAADEVEDLAQLLAWAVQRHPQIGAVSSGAIASDYQRLRVEHVGPPQHPATLCMRLLDCTCAAGGVFTQRLCPYMDPCSAFWTRVDCKATPLSCSRCGCSRCGMDRQWHR